MEQSDLGNAFPNPPAQFSLFTEENVAKVEAARANGDLANLPDELQLLIPPSPAEGAYHSFGDRWDSSADLPSLNDAGIQQLYQTTDGEKVDRLRELRRLAKSLLLNYLELLGVESIGPEGFPEKVEHLRVILINVHHLVNEYRPHQARETLIQMMQQQLEKEQEEARQAQEAFEQVREVAERAAALLKASREGREAVANSENLARRRDLQIFAALEERVSL